MDVASNDESNYTFLSSSYTVSLLRAPSSCYSTFRHSLPENSSIEAFQPLDGKDLASCRPSTDIALECNKMEPLDAGDTLNSGECGNGKICSNTNNAFFGGLADEMETSRQTELEDMNGLNTPWKAGWESMKPQVLDSVLPGPTGAGGELCGGPCGVRGARVDFLSPLCEDVSPDVSPNSVHCRRDLNRSLDSQSSLQQEAVHSGNGPVAGVCLVENSITQISPDDIHRANSEVSLSNLQNLSNESPSDGSRASPSIVLDWSSSSTAFTACSCSRLSRSKTTPSSLTRDFDVDISNENLSRSKTEKMFAERQPDGGNPLMSSAEKLSERKKKKIIENLVRIQSDGTVEVDVDRSTAIDPKLFDLDMPDHMVDTVEEEGIEDMKFIPPLNIAMLIVGTRGDVQPFVGIGKRLQAKGNRVRLATHANFREFVTCNGLEFYPLGGDPKVLAGYMVKNKGFLPSGPSEISIQKKQLKAIMHSLLPACTEPDGESGLPFKADAIIANPPAYGNVHVAEYLQIPLHIFFTMPWTPTNEFPHPLARVKKQAGYRLSYLVVDSLMWWGMRGLINEFRMKKLNLHRITYFNTSQGSISQLPTGYIWSPHLVPKPRDWGPRVDVVGFCFLNLAAGYRPPDTLMEWLQAGEKPIYVGFGSLPVEDPGGMTEIIVQALQETNERGIIDKGWGGLGALSDIPDFIFLLENCPHDWLFPRCAAVVHHGGAGTTAAGLKAGCPTTIVPFFGDQPFWGEQVHAKGVGPPPIPIWQFSLERLKNAIKFMLDPEVKKRAKELAKKIEEEDGIGGAVDAFYRHWPKSLPQSASTKEPPSLFDYFIFYLEKLSCMSCCS